MPKIIHEEDVFKAVIKVLVAQGYDRATTRAMAAAAGIHEATLFRKYGSKVGLIERAVEHQLSNAPLSKAIYTGDLRDDLIAILDAYVATFREYGEIVPMLLLEVPRYPELQRVLATPLANIRHVAGIIARYQRDGRLRKEPPVTSVTVLLAPILMHQILKRADTSVPAPDIDLPHYVDAFLYGREP